MLNSFMTFAQAAANTAAETAPAAAAQGKPQPENGLLMWVPMILIFVVMFWLMSRTQKKQQQKRQEMLEKIKKGDRVMIGGGLYGNVVEVKDQTFVVEIANNVRVEVAKGGVNSVVEDTAAAAK